MIYEDAELESMSDAELVALLAESEIEVSKCNIMQLGLKVTLNSAYGMIGNEYSRYFDTRLAEGITVSGQLSIRWIERKLDEYLNKVCGTEDHSFAVAGDTDSIYLSLNPLVQKYFEGQDPLKIVSALDKFCEVKVQPVIDDAYNELADYMNVYQQKMFMAREVIADRGIWRKKKNYALNVWNSEGVQYDEPHIKISGIESVRSSTPSMCRDAIKESLRSMLTSDEPTTQAYIAETKARFMEADYNVISRNSGVSDIDKWVVGDNEWKSGCPWHVKASIMYNRILCENPELRSKYPLIRSGDKVKILHLKKENPLQAKHIAYPDELPPEFALDKFIDRKTQFDVTYMKPVLSLLDIIGWTPKRVNKLF